MDNEITLESINNLDPDQEMTIGQMLRSSDKEQILLGIAIAQLRERWIEIFDQFMEYLNKDENTTINHAIGGLYSSSIPLGYQSDSDPEAWKQEKQAARATCANNMLTQFFNTERSIYDAEDLETSNDVFASYKIGRPE